MSKKVSFCILKFVLTFQLTDTITRNHRVLSFYDFKLVLTWLRPVLHKTNRFVMAEKKKIFYIASQL